MVFILLIFFVDDLYDGNSVHRGIFIAQDAAREASVQQSKYFTKIEFNSLNLINFQSAWVCWGGGHRTVLPYIKVLHTLNSPECFNNMTGYTGEKGRGGRIEDFYYNKMARIAQYSDQNYTCLKLFKLNSTNPVYPTYNNNNLLPSKTTLSLFLPAILSILVICIHWNKNNVNKKYNDIQFRYLFLKSKKKQRHHINLFVFPKLIFLIKVITLYNLKSVDIYSGNDLYPKQSKDFFSIESINFTDHVSSKVTNLNFEMYALSKLKLKNHSQFFRYIMLLSGDIELNPGPIRQPCSICSKLVNKRSLFCLNCNLATV